MKVIHDKEAQKFFLTKEENESYLYYRMQNGTMNIFRTYVPSEFRKRGLAAMLAKAALDYAKENNLKVIPSCSYTDYYIDQHKEYKELLA